MTGASRSMMPTRSTLITKSDTAVVMMIHRALRLTSSSSSSLVAAPSPPPRGPLLPLARSPSPDVAHRGRYSCGLWLPRHEEALGGEMENTKRDVGRSCHVGVAAKSVGDTSEYVCSSVVGLCRQDELKLLKRGVGGSVRGGWTLLPLPSPLLPLPPALLLVPAISATGSANVAWRFNVEYGRWLTVRQPRCGSVLVARRGGGVGTGTNGTLNGVSSRRGIDCRFGGAPLPPALFAPVGSRLACAP